MKKNMSRSYPLYDQREEHDACGVGFVAAIDGTRRRDIVEKAIAALRAVWHRGAVGADGKTGDGAGIHLAIPPAFFEEQILRTGHKPLDGQLAVGMIFLPRTDLEAKEKSRSIIESEILRAGHYIYGWRHVPVDLSVVGDIAQRSRPEIEQILIADKKRFSPEEFERDLYLIRRRIEKAAVKAQINGLYICSLSSRSIIYKGLFLAEHLSTFYPDLLDDRFESDFAIFHQRYSTNTFPQWWLAQPFRVLAHNGEINTIRGNINWMKNHEIKMASRAFGDSSRDIKPVIPLGASDSAALDAVFEVLVRAGRSAPMAKTMLMPETWSRLGSIPDAHRDMYAHINSVMEPWDGPAAIAATDGRWVLAGLDRSGLRPLRYTVTSDRLVCAGSEAGMFRIPAAEILYKGRVGPGQMIGIDLQEGRFFEDGTLKDRLAARHPYAEWVKGFKTPRDFEWDERDAGIPIVGDDLFHRQLAAGITSEILEHILHPQAESASEAVGSMGDDTPPAVIAKTDRNLAHFFRQRFSQVTNPPLDSIRERRVMSLLTRIGNFADVLDQDNPQSDVLVMDSPVLLTGDYHALRRHFGDKATVIDCTFEATADPGILTDAIERIKREAGKAVENDCGQLFLTDENIDRERASVPMILAAGGIHTHLLAKGLRANASINVRAAECFDAHYLAVLIGVGATTVNPYLAQSSIRDRHEKNLFGDLALKDCFANFKQSLEASLLKIIAKMGVSIVSSYRGAYNFEALGLSRALVNEFFPGLPSRISGIGMGWIKRSVLNRHKSAFERQAKILPIGGFLHYRAKGEAHGLSAYAIHALQMATASGSYDHYQRYLATLKAVPPINLRDLLDFEPVNPPVAINKVLR